MRLVIQRVKESDVNVQGSQKPVGQIGLGLLVLVGVGKKDSLENARQMALKLSKLRVMADKEGKMNLTVKDVSGAVLAVSQFTLYADTSGGNRPSFVDAALPQQAEEIYLYFVQCLREEGLQVQTGKFGAYMDIAARLDGPVTILLQN